MQIVNDAKNEHEMASRQQNNSSKEKPFHGSKIMNDFVVVKVNGAFDLVLDILRSM